MAKARRPRKGSLQFHPRKRAKHHVARVRSWPASKEAKLLGFAAYKVGMTQAIFTDQRPNSATKGDTIAWPCTILECPPLRIAGIRYYKKVENDLLPMTETWAPKTNSPSPKPTDQPSSSKNQESTKTTDSNPEKSNGEKKEASSSKEFDDLVIIAQTLPGKSRIGKKKSDYMEIALGGKKEEKESYAKSNLGKEIPVTDVFEKGTLIDIHAITKGKGLQGPVKRFGISLKSHKSEKGRRNPGSLGSWKGQVNVMWKVAYAGQTGYFRRTELNKYILDIGEKPLSPKSGFHRYGQMKNTYLIIRGSIPGPKKRLIRLAQPSRPTTKIPKEAPQIKLTI